MNLPFEHVSLRSLNRLFIAVQTCIGILLFAVVYWSFQQFLEPDQINRQYHQVKQVFSENLQGAFNRYLMTGKMGALNDMAQVIEQIDQTHLKKLPTQSAERIQPLLASLRDLTQTELRSASKVNSEAELLLGDSELQLQSSLDLVMTHVATVENKTEQRLYLLYLAKLYSNSKGLNLLRERYIDTLLPEVLTQINTVLTKLSADLDRLGNLPIIEVLSESSTDTTLTSNEIENSYQNNLSDIKNLINGYPKKLDNTLKTLRAIEKVRKIASQQIDMIGLELDTLSKTILATKENVKVNNLVLLSMALLIATGVFALISYTQSFVAKQITELVPAFDNFSAGDFSKDLELDTKIVEIKSLVNAVKSMQESMRFIVLSIHGQSAAVKLNSAQMHEFSVQLGNIVDEQFQITEMNATEITEMSASVAQVAETTQQASDQAQAAIASMSEALNSVNGTYQAVQNLDISVNQLRSIVSKLQASTMQIESVLTVIQGIAEQTNLLALNAAIEAARAGEMGRGFAVVADEVRKLAQGTSKSTREIHNIIQQVVSNVEETSKQVHSQQDASNQLLTSANENQALMEKSQHNVKNISDNSHLIATSLNEQATVMQSVSEHVIRIKVAAETSKQLAEKGENLSQNLVCVSDELNKVVKSLKV